MQPKTYTLTLNEADVNKILNALADQPYRHAAELIADIHRQANSPILASEPTPPTPPSGPIARDQGEMVKKGA